MHGGGAGIEGDGGVAPGRRAVLVKGDAGCGIEDQRQVLPVVRRRRHPGIDQRRVDAIGHPPGPGIAQQAPVVAAVVGADEEMVVGAGRGGIDPGGEGGAGTGRRLVEDQGGGDVIVGAVEGAGESVFAGSRGGGAVVGAAMIADPGTVEHLVDRAVPEGFVHAQPQPVSGRAVQSAEFREIAATAPGATLDTEFAFIGGIVVPLQFDDRFADQIAVQSAGRLNIGRGNVGDGTERADPLAGFIGIKAITIAFPGADAAIDVTDGVGGHRQTFVDRKVAVGPGAALQPEAAFAAGPVVPGQVNLGGVQRRGGQTVGGNRGDGPDLDFGPPGTLARSVEGLHPEAIIGAGVKPFAQIAGAVGRRFADRCPGPLLVAGTDLAFDAETGFVQGVVGPIELGLGVELGRGERKGRRQDRGVELEDREIGIIGGVEGRAGDKGFAIGVEGDVDGIIDAPRRAGEDSRADA